MKNISPEEYKNAFEGKEQEALKQALDIRKFEIELYWKRATYFWTFIGATMAHQAQQGRVPVKIEVLDDLSEYQLPAGAKAEVAIYSDNWKPFAIVRRILLRMKSWKKFVFIGG